MTLPFNTPKCDPSDDEASSLPACDSVAELTCKDIKSVPCVSS